MSNFPYVYITQEEQCSCASVLVQKRTVTWSQTAIFSTQGLGEDRPVICFACRWLDGVQGWMRLAVCGSLTTKRHIWTAAFYQR